MEHTVQRLLDFPLLEKVVVVLDKEDEHYQDIELLRDARVMLAEGGTERYNSVLNGLKVLSDFAGDKDWGHGSRCGPSLYSPV